MMPKCIEVKRAGRMERWSAGGYRWCTAYAVYVDGKELQPWFTSESAANRLKDKLLGEVGNAEVRGGAT